MPTPVEPRAVRAVNLARVLHAVAGAEVPPTRADLAAETALTRATASRLVDDLLAGGLLVELDRATGAGPGRPGTPLALGPGRFAAVGLQVDVGSLAVLVVDLRGDVVTSRNEPRDLRGSDPGEVLDRLAALVRDALGDLPSGTTVVGSGLALPGIVSTDSGTLLRAPNLGWSDVHVPGLLDTSGLGAGPLAVGNEADLASATVSLDRPGRPGRLTDFVYLSGDAGIGGAVVVGGHPLPGRHGWSGEIGHVSVDPAGPACACGSTGCLEQYAGRRVLLAAAGLDADAPASLLVDRVAAGDPAATTAVERAAWALGCALAAVVNVVDVPVIVLGGHLRETADLLRPGLERTLRERVLSAAWVLPTVEPAAAHPAPGALGAAYRELGRVLDDPAAWLTRR